MSDSVPNEDIFDLERVRRLVELMKEHDLGEVDIREGETRIKLRRMGAEPVIAASAPRAAVSAPAAAEESPQADESHISIIVCPTVGSFFRAPNPESPPFVKVGDHVGPETTVGVIEAMKTYSPILAEVSGKIVSVLVENGQAVEFRQPLFKVDTRG